MKTMKSIRLSAATALVFVAVSHCMAADVATCTWNGPASGGNWTNAANWTISRSSGYESYTDAQVMNSYCKWIISSLQNGAVLTNTSASLKIGNLDFNTSNHGTVTLEDVAGAGFIFGQDATVNVALGNTIDCRLRQNNWEQLGKVVVNGQGTFVFRPNGAYFTYRRSYQPSGSATVRLASGNLDWRDSNIISWNSSRLEVDADVTAGWMYSNSQNTKLVFKNGHSLGLGSGEVSVGGIASAYMGTSGSGNLILWGGQDYNWSGALGYTGFFRLIDGLVNYTGSALPTSVAVHSDGAGRINFSASQTIGVLAGRGSTGGIAMPNNSTLSVAGTNAAAVSQFDARISGRTDFVKNGANYDLTLTGDNAWTGTTRIAAGTLGIKRCNYRHGLVAGWTFDDANDLGADFGPVGVPLTFLGGSGVSTQVVNGVSGRPAIHLASPTSDGSDCQAFRVDGVNMTGANGFSKESGAMAVSFWMKPNLDKCGATAYVFRRGSWAAGREFMLWLDGSTKILRLSIDAYTKTEDDLNIYAAASTLGDGNWHHVVASYERQKLQLWYDGELLGEKNTTTALNLEKERDNSWNPVTVADDNSLIFGNSYLGSASHRFDSFIDDVCVWNHALTAAEVAREYALRGGIASPSDALPEPIAHWRFDDESDIGKDEKGNTHLVVNNDMASPVTPSLSSDCSPMGKALSGGCSLKVEGGGYPVGLPTGRNPVSVSLRLMAKGATEWGSIVYWGTNEREKMFRLGYGGSPRRFHASYNQTGNGANVTAAYTDSNRQADHTWVHYVVTYNPLTCRLKIFRDGALESTGTTAWDNIPSVGNFYVNWKTGQSTASASAIDDLRIYDRELTDYEVRALARSLKTGAVGPVLPADSAITVDSGATLRVEGMHVVSNTVSGAGDVAVAVGSRFGASDWSGFTGRVTGDGELVVRKGARGPLSAASVTAPVSFEDDTIVLSYDNLTQPFVRTSGRVILPEKGTISAAPGSDDVLSCGLLKIAECGSYSGPADATGWTVSPAAGSRKRRFIFKEGTLWLQMNTGFTVVVW